MRLFIAGAILKLSKYLEVSRKPRPKGSKNKPKTVKATVDFAAQLAEKQTAKEVAAAEIASITADIDALKADLKTKKAELKSIDNQNRGKKGQS